MMIATTSMALAEVILAISALYGRQVDVALAAVSVPLAGLGGYAYVQGKLAEGK